MSKGFLVLAQNSNNIDYVRQAYALALSIKLSQTTVSDISIITNDPVPEDYKSVFDQIIPIPWIDSSTQSRFKVENRWKVYHCSPYEETIVLDSDMLVLEDLTSYWEKLQKYSSRLTDHLALTCLHLTL